MKKTVFFLCCVVLIFQPIVGILAQDKIELSPKQMEEYGSKKLTVTSYAIVAVNKTTGTGSAPTSTNPASKTWTATQGYESIPEWKFLKVAGYPEESMEAKKRRNTYFGFLFGGSALMLAGLTAFSIPVLNSEYDSPLFYGGIGGTVVGSVAVFYSMRYQGNITPVGRAQTMAENYNRELAQEIKNQ